MSMDKIPPIPTEYRGHRFRSRLEAKWAAFFDLVGWRWEYEPLDLKGYIPDFVLSFYRPLLVEVKGTLDFKDLAQHTKKIAESGWPHEALIVGAKIFSDDPDERSNSWPILGILGEHEQAPPDGSVADLYYEMGVFHKCRKCHEWSLHHREYTFRCRVNGCYEGDHYLDIPDYENVRRMFADASALVQYNA